MNWLKTVLSGPLMNEVVDSELNAEEVVKAVRNHDRHWFRYVHGKNIFVFSDASSNTDHRTLANYLMKILNNQLKNQDINQNTNQDSNRNTDQDIDSAGIFNIDDKCNINVVSGSVGLHKYPNERDSSELNKIFHNICQH